MYLYFTNIISSLFNSLEIRFEKMFHPFHESTEYNKIPNKK